MSKKRVIVTVTALFDLPSTLKEILGSRGFAMFKKELQNPDFQRKLTEITPGAKKTSRGKPKPPRVPDPADKSLGSILSLGDPDKDQNLVE